VTGYSMEVIVPIVVARFSSTPKCFLIQYVSSNLLYYKPIYGIPESPKIIRRWILLTSGYFILIFHIIFSGSSVISSSDSTAVSLIIYELTVLLVFKV
jgi:hypothetical protein